MHKNLCSCCPQIKQFFLFWNKNSKIKLGCYSTLSTSSPSSTSSPPPISATRHGKSSGDHGTLAFFRSHLNRIAVTKELKKDVNACIDFISTVMKGHFLVCACGILGVTSLDGPLTLPPGLHKASAVEQLTFINDISKIVVEHCSLVQGSLTNETVVDNNDGVYNYARILCHYGSLMMEFRDAWQEGDGERILRCWKLFMPHFKTAGCTKYLLETLKLQFQSTITSSPNPHQITWNRFVNIKGGAGNNIPCDCSLSMSTSSSSTSSATWDLT